MNVDADESATAEPNLTSTSSVGKPAMEANGSSTAKPNPTITSSVEKPATDNPQPPAKTTADQESRGGLHACFGSQKRRAAEAPPMQTAKASKTSRTVSVTRLAIIGLPHVKLCVVKGLLVGVRLYA